MNRPHLLRLRFFVGALLLFNVHTAKAAVRSAYGTIASESFNAQAGTCLVNGDLACADGGDFAQYNEIDFGAAGAKQVQILLAVDAANANQRIELRIGSRSGTLIGTMQTASTGGSGTYRTQTATISGATGVRSLFLVFPGSRPTGPIDNFKFVAATSTPTPTPVPTATPTPAPTPTPGPTATPTPVPGAGVFVPPSFFGMHLEQQFEFGWPSVSFGIQRTWNAYPAVFWETLQPTSGAINFTNLDNLVANSLSHNVEILYAIGHVPRWASSNPNGACTDSATGTCYSPADLNTFANYITQLTSRYKGKIKYYELWNEPDANWAGSHAQLVAMAKIAYPIIKAAGGIVLTPSPQGKNGPAWMNAYYAAGGAAYADVLAFHAYLYDAPESLTALVNSYHSIAGQHSADNKPLWDTEHSWGIPSDPFGQNIESQSAWLARFQILSVVNKIERSIWYGWEFDDWGTLFSKSTRTILKTGVTYQNVYNWLVNANVGPCTQSGTLYRCPIVKSTSNGLAVWTTNSTGSVAAPAGYTRYKTIEGTTVPVSAGQTVQLKMAPILFEK